MAACAIGQIPHPDAARLLIPLLRDKHEQVRQTVILALGHTRDPAAVEPLIEALGVIQEYWGPMFIARALGEIGDPRALPALQSLLKHKDSVIQGEAREAIGKIQAKANPPREESR
jgi:HEAT repeat protein